MVGLVDADVFGRLAAVVPVPLELQGLHVDDGHHDGAREELDLEPRDRALPVVPGCQQREGPFYGAAGQQPDYQVSSPVFDSSSFAGDSVASTAQYYHTTQMVRKDTAEMSRSAFASCFTTSNAALLLGVYGQALPTKDVSVTWHPVTFAKGWSRAGVATITLPGAGPLHLVMAVATAGHYEVTLGALVGQWPEAKGLVANLVNTWCRASPRRRRCPLRRSP